MPGYLSEEHKMNGYISGTNKMTGNIMETVLKGLSAYEIAVKNGFEGTEVEWLKTLVGESIIVEVVKDTKKEYILSFTSSNEQIITPNLKPVLEKGSDQLTPEEIEEFTKDITVNVKNDIDNTYQRKGSYIEGTILSIKELEDLLQ